MTSLQSIESSAYTLTIPKLEFPKVPRYREYNEYMKRDRKLVENVVIGWIFEGKTHREMDRDYLGLDSDKSHGLQSCGILARLGLRESYRGLFKGKDVRVAVEALAEASPANNHTIDLICSHYNIPRNTVSLECDAGEWSDEQLVVALYAYKQLKSKGISRDVDRLASEEVESMKNIMSGLSGGYIRSDKDIVSQLADFDSCSTGNTSLIANFDFHKKTKKIWNDFSDQESLNKEYARIVQKAEKMAWEDIDRNGDQLNELTDVAMLRMVRLCQAQFRKDVIDEYDGRCCITGLGGDESADALLEACHIKDWGESDAYERKDMKNGLCLNTMFHTAFDAGWLAIDTNYEVQIARGLKDHIGDKAYRQFFEPFEGSTIERSRNGYPRKSYLEMKLKKFRDYQNSQETQIMD